MTLLATSTATKKNKVRILFYGQSITEQDWWKRVVADLQKRFPHADVEAQNRAIGGFASQLLIRPAEHDLYPFYPDLLVFHVYGSDKEYEQIVKNVRMRTAAEVLMQTDHLTRWPPATIDYNKDKGAWWDDRMNRQVLPALAKKYRCGLADVRGGWADYLKAHKLDPKALLSDGVHLNDHGNYLMAQLVGRHLVHRPDLPGADWKGLVRTYEVGKDVHWKDGKLSLPFEGNRIDVLARKSTRAVSPAGVRIDGKKPSEHPGAYAIARPTPGPWSALALVRVDREKPLVEEEWTLKLTSMSEDGKNWRFSVAGSRTGPDGEGGNKETFVSKSGRVKIEPAAWFRNGKPPVGHVVRWKVGLLGTDTYRAPEVKDGTREHATTLVQGIANGKHVLELRADGKGEVPIEAIRVYRPSMK